MNVTESRKVLIYFTCLIFVIGIVTFCITPLESGALAGLAAGTFAAGINYLLLHLMMKFLISENYFMVVQTYVIRLLIYLIAAFLSVRFSIPGIAGFGSSIIAISFAIFLVYGIGGLRQND